MDNQEWLQGLKVGDRVVVAGPTGRAMATVERITKTRVMVNGLAFNRTRGTMVGSSSIRPTRIMAPVRVVDMTG